VKVYEVASSQINELREKMLAAKKSGNQRKVMIIVINFGMLSTRLGL
jgi:hypothetical protein